MSEPLQNIPQEIRSEIASLVSRGKKIDAIKRYREATGCDLKTGRDAIDSLFDGAKYSSPQPLPAYSSDSGSTFVKKMPRQKNRTDEPLNDIPQHIRYEITGLLYSGNKVAAIKRYREATGCNLKTAKATIESFIIKTRENSPGRMPEYRDSGDNILTRHWKSILLLPFIPVAINYFPANIWSKWLAKLGDVTQNLIDEVITPPVETQVLQPQITKRSPANQPVATPLPTEPAAQPEHLVPYEPVAPGNAQADLTALYRMKLANQDYVAWKNLPGLPMGYQDFIEEHHIKYKRAEIASHLVLPPGKTTLRIPVLPGAAITLDGAIREQEWARAARFKLQQETDGSTLYLQADENWLYLAADVPGDTTSGGYDQFRFYIHVDIDPAIRNERIHVGRNKQEILGGIRETRIEWQGSPPANDDERWKKYPISDWRIYRLAKGASAMNPHRQFEARLNLVESGLAIGKPFPVFVEIETDPVEEGGSRKRRYLGELGSQSGPAWMIMQPPGQ